MLKTIEKQKVKWYNKKEVNGRQYGKNNKKIAFNIRLCF